MKKFIITLALSLAANQSLAAEDQPLYSVTAPSEQQILDLANTTDGRQPFAYAVPMSLSPQLDGVWSELGEQRLWSAVIEAPGARSLHFEFDVAYWPSSGVLTIGSPETGENRQYQASDVREGRLWTLMMPGSRMQINWSSSSAEPQPKWEITSVSYGISDPRLSAKHGTCNVDTFCFDNAIYMDAIDSTVLLLIRNFACSGFLVNNTRQDRTPYILTANHCGINRANDAGVQVFWRYEDNKCDNSNPQKDPGLDERFAEVGVELLANGDRSDFSLLVLGSAANPSEIPANSQPYWSGWDVGDTAPQSGFSVHHPAGDEKSISFFDSPAVPVSGPIDDEDRDAWQVVWDKGTTEQGSSGSGLWNQDHRVVGLLSGGAASCSNQGAPDLYARLNVAWEEFDTCDRQLKFWLDPDFSDVMRLDGLAQGAANPSVPNCVPGTPVGNTGPDTTPGATAPPATPNDGGSGPLQFWLLGLLLIGCCNNRIRNKR